MLHWRHDHVHAAEPQYNKPSNTIKSLDEYNNILPPRNNKVYRKEPWYNKPHYSKFILLLPWPLAFIISRFHHTFQRSMPISCYLKSGDSLFCSMATSPPPPLSTSTHLTPVWWCLQLTIFLTSSEFASAHKLISHKSFGSYQWHLFFNIFKYTFLVKTLFNYM